MVVDPSFISVLIAAFTGLGLSVVIERCMSPCPPLLRSPFSWGIHSGVWLIFHALMTLLLGRPWFATATVSAVLLTLVLVNNAKITALREPFVYQDYEYFTDMVRYPRLYIPFMGWWKFMAATAGFVLAISVGFWGESPPHDRFSFLGQLGGIGIVLLGGSLLLFFGNRMSLSVCFDPVRDLHSFGFLTCLWKYREEEQSLPSNTSPLSAITPCKPIANLPHLVAVQSESFFDPRSMFSGIKTEVLKEYDRLKQDSVAKGTLYVPAWGANTVRTEFSFLSGISLENMGVHRFNPYRAIAGNWEVQSLASFLKTLGYRTICIHPYPASFYKRDLVFPCLGFDDFIDIRSFDIKKRFGPYISDVAVADKVTSILDEAGSPLFVFVITMENHGPLHLEKISPADIGDLYSAPPPAGCEDLTIYLRHLRNADRMIAKIRHSLDGFKHPASVCWYGDHVPIMPAVYDSFGEPSGNVEYCVWNNREMRSSVVDDLVVENLSIQWLRMNNLID